MAIAGSAVQAIRMRLDDGKLIIVSRGLANGAIVVDDVAEAYQLLLVGKQIHLHNFGYNLKNLEDMLNAKTGLENSQPGQDARHDRTVY